MLVGLLIAGGLTWWHIQNAPGDVPAMTGTYHAVLLSNGQVYFGRLEGLGTRFPVPREVYYIQSAVDQTTKQQQNILLKRGSEWHSPDHMILNGSQIILVEPVGPNSRVSQLIEKLKSGEK